MFERANSITAYNYESYLWENTIKVVTPNTIRRSWWHITPSSTEIEAKLLIVKLKELYGDRYFVVIRRYNLYNVYWRYKRVTI